MRKRCIVIPAIKKNAVIPDQLVKKLAGVTLIERGINTARGVVGGEDIYVSRTARRSPSSASGQACSLGATRICISAH